MNYDIGMFGGAFNPLHLGHVNNIIEAACVCRKLYVVLSYSLNRDEIDYKERFKWLKQITKDMENVEVIKVEDQDVSKEEYDWNKGAQDIKDLIGKKIDVVFCGDDYKGENVFESLYKESEIVYFNRDIINISSTEIREDPYKYYEYLPRIVQDYYVKKVVVFGTESCGKSTLIRNLAKVYNTNFIEEVGRDICEEAGGYENMQPSDYTKILLKHKLKEIEGSKLASKVLFIDTEAIVTLYYLNLDFPMNDEIIDINNLGNSLANLNEYDLCLFLEPDVKWVDDGTRTFGDDDEREENNKILKAMLEERNVQYEDIVGDYKQRFNKAKKLVNNLFKNRE